MRPKNLNIITIIILVVCSGSAPAADDELIQRELLRASNDPDNSTTIVVQQPVALVFDALLRRLAEYSEEVARIDFDHGDAETPGTLGIGSLRITTMEDGGTLVQRIVLFEPPRRFAYYTDMSLSTVSVPIDYSVGFYSFVEGEDAVTATVSVAYQPSSRLTAFLVRIGFNRALARDFARAEAYLNSLE